MKIVKVQPDDVLIITDILLNLINETDRKNTPPSINHIKKLLNDDRCYLLAAITSSIPVGYALAYRFPSLYVSENLAYLYDIEVNELHRRKGIARLLIQNLLTYLKADGVTELWLGTGVDNTPAQGLYTATGAVKSTETFNDYTYYL